MIQTILFPTDLCVFTPYLMKHVTDLAQRWGAKVVLVHAVEPLSSLGAAVVKTYLGGQFGRDFSQAGLESLVTSIRERIVDLLADELVYGGEGTDVIQEVVVEIGKPAEIILTQAQSCGADLLVLGSHSPDRGGICDGALGSVAAKVLQQSKIPVYFVPVLPYSPAAATIKPDNRHANGDS